MKKTLLTIYFLFITIFFIGCNDLSKYTISFAEKQIYVTINEEVEIPFTSNIKNTEEIKYSFSKPNIVQKEGNKFIFTELGDLTLKVYWEENEEIFDSILIIVQDITRDISTENRNLTIYKGEEMAIDLNLTNLNLDNLAYKTSNETTISVTNDWKIKANEIGIVTLIIYYINNEDIQLQIEVVVQERKSIKFNESKINIDLDAKNIELPIVLTGITLSEIAFNFDKYGIIKIEGNKIVPLKIGTVVLSAVLETDFSISAKLIIEVMQTNPPLTTSDYEYWVENLNPKYDSKEIILTQPQITNYNKTIFSNYNLTKVVDLINQPPTISKTELETMINAYSHINKYSVYNNGTIISSNEKSAILANRNIDNILDTTEVKYGIITNFSALRSYPTNFISNSPTQDRFQETGLNVGEGAIIYHSSSDQQWYFIQAANYNGWIEANNIALCSNVEMKQFLTADNFVLITADKLLINDVYVRMGQKIPYVSKLDNSFTVSFPTRNLDGNLLLKEIVLDRDLDISDGYLDYNLENIFKQGFKMLGIPYSWGDKDVNGRDCSSTQNAIYACFGFIMPRNTSNQSNIPTYSKNVNNLSIPQLKDQYSPGTLIFSSSHVLMYIGDDIHGNPFVLHNTSASIAGCKVQSIQSYGINKIIAILKTS